MHNADLVLTLSGGLAAALVLGYVTHRVGLSPIVGYLMAGLVVGPHTPGFVANPAMAEQLAEVGVILLMFGVGLHFHVDDLLAVRHVAVPGAVGQSLFATGLVAAVMQTFGWNWTAGIVFGLAISVASTVVLLRVLSDSGDLHTPTGRIAVGWLVVEDVFTIIVLVLLPMLGGVQQAGWGNIALALGKTSIKIVVLVVLTLFVGERVVPKLLERVAAARSRELFTLAVLVVALGIAAGAAMLFGVSMALGAFLAGMVVGRSEFSLRAASDAIPMRDAFAVLFFISVGMLFDPQILTKAPGLVAATCGIVLIGKPLAALAIVLILRYPLKVALSVSVALAQIGEFSFILASLGRDLKILSDDATGILVAASIVSITLNPVLYRMIGSLERWTLRQRWLARWLPAPLAERVPAGDEEEPRADRHLAIVVGYGPVGQTVTRLLSENQITPVVIEMNLETVRKLREAGVDAVYGDASHRETLASAGVEQAGSLILSASSIHDGPDVIRMAREMNPRIRVLARTNYVREIPALHGAGAAHVYSGESEVALALIEIVLRTLGASSEQIDRERARFREKFLPGTDGLGTRERAGDDS